MLRVLEIIVPVFGIVLIGFLYGRRRAADMTTANRINVVLFTPALVFFVLSEKVTAGTDLLLPALGAAAVVLGSGLLCWPVGRLMGFRARTLVPPVMFNNSGNMGLPLAVFAFGEAALPVAVILFVVELALHFTVGTWMLSGRLHPVDLLRNPILLATALGLWAQFGGWHAPEIIAPGVEMLAEVAVPLMLVSLGIRLTDVNLADWRIGVTGALLTPVTGVLAALGFIALVPLPGELAALLILFGALPPAVLNYILSEHYDQDPAQVASIVVLGNLAALVVIPLALWWVVA